MTTWLLNRLFDTKDQPKPRFAFQGTVNWMRALSVLVSNTTFEDDKIKDHYKSVNRRKLNKEGDTLVFENMMMAFHSHASLVRLREDVTHPYDVCRSAIISWYYSTYFTCSAMIAAASGAKQETHALTAKVWQSDIVDAGWVISPFSLSLCSLVEKDMNSEVAQYRGTNEYDLNKSAENDIEAWGAVVSYLRGTGEYEKWRVEEEVKNSTDFKALGFKDFRTKRARALRDARLGKKGVNYLIQAFRYRGKANYRDSIFLSYGDDNSKKVEEFLQDLEKVSYAFQRMAAFYVSRRVEKDTWSKFTDDLIENSRISLPVKHLEV